MSGLTNQLYIQQKKLLLRNQFLFNNSSNLNVFLCDVFFVVCLLLCQIICQYSSYSVFFFSFTCVTPTSSIICLLVTLLSLLITLWSFLNFCFGYSYAIFFLFLIVFQAQFNIFTIYKIVFPSLNNFLISRFSFELRSFL